MKGEQPDKASPVVPDRRSRIRKPPAPEPRRLTRREVLSEMGKAVYAAPLLVPLKRPNDSPQIGSPPPPPNG